MTDEVFTPPVQARIRIILLLKKKIFLTTMALLTMASASVFGMYGVDSDWINFITHGNQFRARLETLGFVLGNDTIKGTFGFRNDANFGGIYGAMLNHNTGDNYNWVPSISMGIGYTSSAIGIGVGYSATVGQGDRKDNGKMVNRSAHTPVLVLNAMDNDFRMAIPIQVYVNEIESGRNKTNVIAVSVDSQFRYYTGLDFLPQIRLYLRYGYYGYNETAGEKTKGKYAESFGFDFRIYFGAMVEEVALQPYIKLAYNGALGKYHNFARVQAVNAMQNAYTTQTRRWGTGVWNLQLMPALGLTANSDIVSIYLEPSLGLNVRQNGSATQKNVKEVYGLGYNVYAEIYITPLKNLEWYFEASIGNVGDTTGLSFAGTTGVTWYLPAL